MSGSDTLEARPSKRTRLSADDPVDCQTHPSGSSSTSSANTQCHPEVWFDDGNIVLVARMIAFPIYRGLLAAQSTIFSDMFASATSNPDVNDSFNGCLVVHLSDSLHDLAHLLRLLLPKSNIHFHTAKANLTEHTFDEVSALICLAHKYHIPQVQDQALALLQEYWFTSSLTVFSGPPPTPDITIEPVHAIGAVNLARLTDTPSMLPLALYRCASLGSALFDGWAHEDGTVEHLSDADLQRCADARVVLAHEHHFVLSCLFDDAPSAGCHWPNACVAKMRADLHRMAIRSEARVRCTIMDWSEPVQTLEKSGALCRRCAAALLERNERERKKVFDKLPEIFGITVDRWGADMEMETKTNADTDAGEVE